MINGLKTYDDSIYNSRLSFRPLIESIKASLSNGSVGSRQLYGSLIDSFEATPELMQPLVDDSIITKHRALIDTLLATLFPATLSENELLYAVSYPFQFKTIYTSPIFGQLFLKQGTDLINVPGDEIGMQLREEKLRFAYHLILKQFAGYKGAISSNSVYPYTDPFSGLTKHLELSVDARFVDVKPVDKLPVIPDDMICPRTNRIIDFDRLIKEVPLDKFVFEGLVIVKVHDVTKQEVISQIKNSLLDINAFSDETVYDELQKHMLSLLGVQDARIGITPFFRVNGHFVHSQLHNSNSLLFKQYQAFVDRDDLGDCCTDFFKTEDQPVVFETLDESNSKEIEYLKVYYDQGARSLIVCPLKFDGQLIGLLEIVSTTPGKLNHSHILQIEEAIPLFSLALEKSSISLDNQIDKVIKEQFTAVQPSVEWKFTETALDYIVGKKQDEDKKIGEIKFEDVYPLYGAIDIRNSSTERSHAIQLDLIEQLNAVKKVLRTAQIKVKFPLLQEIEFKVDKYIMSASDILFSEEETTIHEFLTEEIVSVFNHLSNTIPAIRKDIEEYFSSLDASEGKIIHHRKEYEQSIAKINDTIAKFIDKEQVQAQQVYPHYFERYVTDGIEFNAYIGQSIAPRQKFDELYLRNMKMWQLSVLAKAARQVDALAPTLPHPLKITQLILAHSMPISISFRAMERKFDVDGSYNIRYEIIKKRIDKVRIKGTNERLTQPGKIAIVYSQPKEAAEYIQYIEFLQNQKLLKPGIEKFELEELQGVVGLKALRVDIDPGNAGPEVLKIELSGTTFNQLLQ